MTTVLMIGSAPMAIEVAGWPRQGFDRILAINNAHLLPPIGISRFTRGILRPSGAPWRWQGSG